MLFIYKHTDSHTRSIPCSTRRKLKCLFLMCQGNASRPECEVEKEMRSRLVINDWQLTPISSLDWHNIRREWGISTFVKTQRTHRDLTLNLCDD
jgi:hypothetical protein